MNAPSGSQTSTDTSDTAAALLSLAVATAREAGELIVSMRARGVEVAATKSSLSDVVTEADRACERLVRERLLGNRPDDAFIGEESDGDEAAPRPAPSGVTWIVDPIDGTVNYLYGLPDYAVSIAAALDGETVAGVVLSPGRDLEYTATRGGGGFRNGTPLAQRASPALAQALVATGFGYDARLRARQGRSVARMLPYVRDIRRMGSCALDLCAVAEGLVDAYVEEGPHIWDHAAAGLVAREAGAILEVSGQENGNDLLVCAPEPGFAEFSTLVDTCGFRADARD